MGFARAIKRVKSQAKQGGLHAVMAGLGEELRSKQQQIPAPLRGAAQRIAALLEGGRSQPSAVYTVETIPQAPATARTAAQAQGCPVSAGAERSAPASSEISGIQPIERTQADDGASGEAEASLAPAAAAQAVGMVAPGTPAEALMSASDLPRVPPGESASKTGSDLGAEPGPVEPEQGTPVDPEEVGATPSVIAGHVEVEAVDATPTDVTADDVTPTEVEPLGEARQGEPEVSGDDAAKAERGKSAKDKPSQQASARTDGQNSKQELAPNGGAAKNLARSSSRGAKKRSGSRANTSKKK